MARKYTATGKPKIVGSDFTKFRDAVICFKNTTNLTARDIGMVAGILGNHTVTNIVTGVYSSCRYSTYEALMRLIEPESFQWTPQQIVEYARRQGVTFNPDGSRGGIGPLNQKWLDFMTNNVFLIMNHLQGSRVSTAKAPSNAPRNDTQRKAIPSISDLEREVVELERVRDLLKRKKSAAEDIQSLI